MMRVSHEHVPMLSTREVLSANLGDRKPSIYYGWKYPKLESETIETTWMIVLLLLTVCKQLVVYNIWQMPREVMSDRKTCDMNFQSSLRDQSWENTEAGNIASKFRNDIFCCITRIWAYSVSFISQQSSGNFSAAISVSSFGMILDEIFWDQLAPCFNNRQNVECHRSVSFYSCFSGRPEI